MHSVLSSPPQYHPSRSFLPPGHLHMHMCEKKLSCGSIQTMHVTLQAKGSSKLLFCVILFEPASPTFSFNPHPHYIIRVSLFVFNFFIFFNS